MTSLFADSKGLGRKSWIACTLSISLSLAFVSTGLSAGKINEKPLVKPVENIPKQALLKEMYVALKEFRPDRALWAIARMLTVAAKSKDGEKVNRKAMARLMVCATRAFAIDDNLKAADNVSFLAYKLLPDDPEVMCNRAAVLARLCQFDRFDRLMERIEKIPNKSATEYMTLAMHARVEDRPEAAMEYLKAAEPSAGNKAIYHVLLARTFMSQGLGEESRKEFLTAADLTENPYIRELLLADAAIVQRDEAGQEEHLNAAGRIYPDDPAWKVKLASFDFVHDREGKALKLVHDALNSQRYVWQARTAWAAYLAKKKRYGEARQVVQSLEEATSQSSESFALRADYALGEGKKAEAEKLYQEAIKFDPHSVGAYQKLARFYLSQNKNSEALDVMKRCTEVQSNSYRARFAAADIALLAHDRIRAALEAQSGLDILKVQGHEMNVLAQHLASRAHAIIGSACYLNGEGDKATKEAKLHNQLRFLPNLPGYLKLVVLRPGRLKFNDKLKGDDPMLHVALADMLYETETMNKCIAEYRIAKKLAPEDADVNSYLLHALSKQGDWAGAAQENLALSQKIVGKIPASIGDWTNGNDEKKKQKPVSQ